MDLRQLNQFIKQLWRRVPGKQIDRRCGHERRRQGSDRRKETRIGAHDRRSGQDRRQASRRHSI